MPTQAGLIDFTAERQRHVRFLGREDVLGQLDQWLDGPGETGWVIVTGGPGMGKSAILSAWLARREATGAVVPHHFVRRQVADWDQPEVIAVSLAAQIEAAFPALRDAEAKPERRLLELLGRVSQQLGATRRPASRVRWRPSPAFHSNAVQTWLSSRRTWVTIERSQLEARARASQP